MKVKRMTAIGALCFAFIFSLAAQPAAVHAEEAVTAQPAAVHAEDEAAAEPGGIEESSIAVQDSEVTDSDLADVPSAAADVPLDFTVDYPADIKCGTPTTFTIRATGGSEKYEYRVYSFERLDDGSWWYVIDPSRVMFSDSNTYDFTFFSSGTYKIRFTVRDKETGALKSQSSKEAITLQINDPAYPSIEAKADSLVQQCLAVGCKSDFDKVLWLHDWILDNCTYDNSFLYCGPEGALARGTGTCEAYHQAFVMLLKRAGIATGRMTGNGHVWTAVKMDGQWYQIDPTWDDDSSLSKGDYRQHLYFGLTDGVIQLIHSDHRAHAGYESNAFENNYFIKTGKISQWSDPFKEQVQQQINGKKTSFSLPVNNGLPDNYNNVLYNLVAYDLQRQAWKSGSQTVTLKVTYSAGTLTFTAQYRDVPVDNYTLRLTPPKGYTDSSVWIDGVEYSSTMSGSQRIVALKDGSSQTAVMYSYDASGVPVGMYVWELSFSNHVYTVRALPGLENLLSYHGFSIRVQAPAGIRFKSGIDAGVKSKLIQGNVDGYRLVEYGTLSMSNARRGQYPFIKDGTAVRGGRSYWTENGTTSDMVFETVNNRARFSSVLINMPSSVYASAQAFRGYIILTDGSRTITLYGPPVARSIYDVAKQIMVRGEFAPGSAGYNYVNSIIRAAESGKGR